MAEDTAHSERYMGMATPSDNLDGYEVSAILFVYFLFKNKSDACYNFEITDLAK